MTKTKESFYYDVNIIKFWKLLLTLKSDLRYTEQICEDSLKLSAMVKDGKRGVVGKVSKFKKKSWNKNINMEMILHPHTNKIPRI